MKIRKFFLFLLVLCTLVTVASCSEWGPIVDELEYLSDEEEDWTINAPVVKLNGSVISWDAVKNAASYDIFYNGTLLTNVFETTFDLSSTLTEDGTYSIQVLGKYGKTSSDLSVAVLYQVSHVQAQLDAPVVTLSGSSISWAAVANATSYEVYSNGTVIGTVTSNSFDLSSKLTEVGTYSIQVVAKNSSTSSLLSSSVSFIVAPVQEKLDAPVVSISGSNVSWAAVANATSYEVYSNGQKIGEVTTTSFVLTSLFTDGTYKIQVVAKNDKASSQYSNVVNYVISSEAETEFTKHLLLNSNGSYGGGDGAPLNGELDKPELAYYSVINYYQRGSTETRRLYNSFRTYQTTHAKTDSIAAALSVLNYYGEDTEKTYTEDVLINMFTQINGQDILTKVVDNGDQMVSLFNALGYSAITETNHWELDFDGGKHRNAKYIGVENWISDNMDQGKMMLVPYWDGDSCKWHVILGFDNMGTDTSYDDVLILADPNDSYDHYQDGYFTVPMQQFCCWWKRLSRNGAVWKRFFNLFVVVSPKPGFDVAEHTKQIADIAIPASVPERHLLIQPDGHYNSDYYVDVFNSIYHYKKGSSCGEVDSQEVDKLDSFEHLNSYYYKAKDYYNMGNNPTTGEYIIQGMRAHEQNMASTCGICALVNILTLYGFDTMTEGSQWSEAQLASDYENINKKGIDGVGTSTSYFTKMFADSKYTKILNVVYCKSRSSDIVGPRGNGSDSTTGWKYPTYESFIKAIKGYMQDGTPMAVSWTPVGGHWEAIMGYCDFGTDDFRDDVIVLVDSHDVRDHYQDGYNTYNALTFYYRWYNGGNTLAQANYVVTKK